MRVPVYIVCAAIIVAVNSEDNYYGSGSASGSGRRIMGSMTGRPSSLLTPEDQETLSYILPRLMTRYRSNNNNKQWSVLAPPPPPPPLPLAAYFYPMSDEIDSNSVDDNVSDNRQMDSSRASAVAAAAAANKRVGPSLSVSNPLDVLRNRLLLEISRKKEMEGVNRNRNLLCQIGKRAFPYDAKRKCEEPSEKFISD